MQASSGTVLSWFRWILILVAAQGCAEETEPSHGPGPQPEAQPELPALILSDPSPPRGSASAGSRAALVDAVVYASLPPGSLRDAALALFTNVRTGAGTTAIVVEGGFDPVPIPAVVGDSLRIRIQAAGDAGEHLYYAKVAPQRAPRVVRSSPSPGRSDVPLNTRIYVVFSEPLLAETVSDSSVQLLGAGVRVPGAVTFVDATGLTVGFLPAAPLEAGATYALRVTQAVTDAGGEPLDVPVTIEFRTAPGAAVPPPPAPDVPSIGVDDVETVLERVTPSSTSSYGPRSRFVLRGDGQFALQYYGDAPGDTVSFAGWYNHRDSTISFDRTILTIGDGGTIQGTARSDSVVVQFASWGDDRLEDGTYVLTQGSLWQTLAPLPEAREGAKAGAWRGTLYVVGGRDAAGQLAPDILAYEPGQNAWRTAGRLMRPVWSPGIAVVGDRIYVIGGSSATADVADVQIFDPGTGTVVAGPALAFGRANFATAVIDGRIHVLGGWARVTSGVRTLGEHDVLDPATLTWSSRSALPSPTHGEGAAVLEGRVYLASASGPLYVYDPIRDAWSSPVRVAGDWGGVGSAVIDGWQYLAGGIDAWGCSGYTFRYSANSVDRWERLMLLPTPRCFSAAVALDGSLYVIGGVLETNRVLPTSPALTTVERMVLRP
jgi:hypothetical protein